jgi:hypothetical protein
MSFGFSISDVINIAQLSSRTYNNWKSACGDHANITGDLDILQALIARFAAEVQMHDSLLVREPDELRQWKRLSKDFRSLLTGLEGILEKHKSLRTSRKKTWDRIRFGHSNIDNLHQKLLTKTTSLSAYMSVLGISSQARVENDLLPQPLGKVDDIAAQMRTGNASAVSRFTSYPDDDKAIWRDFRRHLITSGFRSNDLRKYSAALKTHLGQLQRRGLVDEEDPAENVVRLVFVEAPSCLLAISDPRPHQFLSSPTITDLRFRDRGTHSPHRSVERARKRKRS